MEKRISRTFTETVPLKREAALVPGPRVFVTQEGTLLGKPAYEYSEAEPPTVRATNRLETMLQGDWGQDSMLSLFHCLPEVYSAVNQIASRVSDAVWELRRESTDEPIYTDKEFNRLFNAPNPTMGIRALIYTAVCYELLTGRTFFFLNRPEILGLDYKSIINWWVLPAHQVRVTQKKVDPYTTQSLNDFVTDYRIPGTVNGERIFNKPDTVLPVVNFNLEKPYDLNCSLSYLAGARKAIQNLLAVYEARGVIYVKRGALGFIVSRKTEDAGTVALSPTEKAELELDYNRTYGITGNRSTIGITGQPVDYVAMGSSISDLEPFEETLIDAVAIYATLNIPRHLVPSKDASTFDNGETDEKNFYNNVIIPLANKYANLLTTGMGFSAYKKYVFANYSHIDILQEDKKEKADINKVLVETANVMYEKGIITKNRRNAIVGEEKVEDGDKYADDGQEAKRLVDSLGVGGVTALQALLADTSMDDEAKKAVLNIVFGIKKKDAEKMVIEKILPDANEITPEGNSGPKEEIRTNKLPRP